MHGAPGDVLKAAVLGSPVAHSLSPALHTAAFRALGLSEWSYAACDVGAEELPRFVDRLDADWRGLSLTMPLKEAALGVATTVSGLAREAGAANTLVRRTDGGWAAENTDVDGIVEALRPGLPPSARHGVVLGSGATARSAILALRRLDVTRTVVAARSPERAAAALDRFAMSGVQVVPLPAWGTALADVVVSTLPPEAAGAALPGLAVTGGALLLDVVYDGWPTPLARAAHERGIRTVSGLDMLVHQAARQFRLFTGHVAPLAAMFAAARR